MVTNRKPTGRASSMPAGLLFGAAVSMTITLLSAAVLAKLTAAEVIEESRIGYGVMIMLLAASFVGAMGAYFKIKRQRLAVCALSGVIYFLMLLCITALFFGGQYEAVGVTGALVLGGSLTAGILGSVPKRGGKRGKIKLPNR